MRLTHVRLLVRRFDECLRFYRDVVGFPVAWGEEGGRYADLDAGEGVTLALFARDALAQAVGASGLPAEASARRIGWRWCSAPTTWTASRGDCGTGRSRW